MSNLTSPQINVIFTELGVSAIARGNKGVVGIIVRDAKAAEVDPLAITQTTQIPTTLGTANQDYISRTFLGYVNPPKKVLVYVIGEEAELTAALNWFATQEFDYLVGPADCTAAEATTIAAWIMSQREAGCSKAKAVLPNHAADKYPIVNFATEEITVGKVVYATAAYCSRVAGLLAGTPMKISATFAPMPEVTDVTRLDKPKQNEAVAAGKLIAIWDGRKAKLCRGVNSMTTTSAGMLDSFKKIKIVEVMDLARTDITTTIEDEYIGKYPNTYDNKLLLVTAIRSYFEGLKNDELVQPGYTVDIDVDAQATYLTSKGEDISEMSDQEIREADTGTHIFIKITCKILDAVEDVDVAIAI